MHEGFFIYSEMCTYIYSFFNIPFYNRSSIKSKYTKMHSVEKLSRTLLLPKKLKESR